jgi:tetratricopeptide (TPR) repeat protein
MQIRTPRKYRGRQRRGVIPWRRLLMLMMIIGIIYAGYQIVQNQAALQQRAETIMLSLSDTVGDQMATLNAPPPTLTPDPAQNLVAGDNAWAMGNTSEAVRSYMLSINAVPNNVNVHNRVTMGLLASGNTQEALDYAQNAVTADPYSADAWVLLSWAQSDNGDVGSAIASAIHAKTLAPQQSRVLAFLARAYLADEQVARAQNVVEEAITLDPDAYEGYWVRGQINEQGLFDFVSAADDYRTAYEIALTSQPTMAGVVAVDIALIQRRNQDFDGAIATLEQARELNAENTLALFWLGVVYFSDKGDPNQSQTYLQQCVDYNPNSYNCSYFLGRTQFALDQVGAATESFNRATELDSPFPRHWWWTANAYFAQGNCTKAGEYLRKGYDLIDDSTPQDLRDAYDYLISSCGFTIGRPTVVTPTPEITADPNGT